MQTLTFTQQDYDQIVKMAKRDYHEDFQIDYEKDGCVLSVSMNHIEKWRKMVGASFMGFSERIGECLSGYEVTDVECMNENDEVVRHDFDGDLLCRMLN